jgi:hypothetical protein
MPLRFSHDASGRSPVAGWARLRYAGLVAAIELGCAFQRGVKRRSGRIRKVKANPINNRMMGQRNGVVQLPV